MNRQGKSSNKGKEGGKGKSVSRTKNVEFSFYAPEATEVYVAGEFNRWEARSLPMDKDENGVWKAKVKLLPGRHEYKLFADSAWIEDIPGAESVPNPFGTSNFVMSVP